jgi:ketosteroid isomerase-like protein
MNPEIFAREVVHTGFVTFEFRQVAMFVSRPRIAALGCTALLATLAGCATVAMESSAKSVVEAKFAAVNRHSIDDIEKLYAPFASVTAPNFCNTRHGREDVRRIYQDLFTAFPDIHVEIQEYLVQGDRVAVRYLVRAGSPGKGFVVPIFNLFTVRDGLITTDDGMFDNGGRKCS